MIKVNDNRNKTLPHNEELPARYERVWDRGEKIVPRRSSQYVMPRRRERKMGSDRRKNASNMDLRSVVASSDVNPTSSNRSRLVSSDGTWER